MEKTPTTRFKDIELWHGDCLELMERIPDGSVDFIFCDLPYAHLRADGSVRKCTANAWDSPIDIPKLWDVILRVAHQNTIHIFTCIQPFTSLIVQSQPNLFRYELIWEKSMPAGFLWANKRPLRSHENIIVFSEKLKTYNPLMTPSSRARKDPPLGFGKNYNRVKRATRGSASGYPRSVNQFSYDADRFKGNVRGLHPTQKPMAMMNWLIQTYTNAGDLALDPAAGSMTTAVAAHQTGRRAICIEKSDEFYAKGVERVKQAMAAPRQATLAL